MQLCRTEKHGENLGEIEAKNPVQYPRVNMEKQKDCFVPFYKVIVLVYFTLMIFIFPSMRQYSISTPGASFAFSSSSCG